MINYNLKRLRLYCGLTQKQIADQLNIDRSTYTYYETGKTVPDVETLRKLSRLYYITLDTLVDSKIDLNKVKLTFSEDEKVGEDKTNLFAELINNHIELGKGRLNLGGGEAPAKEKPKLLFNDLTIQEQNVIMLFRRCKDKEKAVRLFHEFVVSGGENSSETENS
ncbi:MAG: helix-turn-helix transcriptional regulator [Eubacteriales bacterium]